MTVSASVHDHLNRKGVMYDVLNHPHSRSSLESARLAQVPADQVAKGVLTHDGENYLLCVIPSNHRLSISSLNESMNGNFTLVSEHRLGEFFDDCEIGAIPALGQIYGLHVLWDEALVNTDDLYIESGDHENLIHVTRSGFMELMGGQEHMNISFAQA
ncbi:MAG: YbaK/EbsC family protein [Halioglobus sp.]